MSFYHSKTNKINFFNYVFKFRLIFNALKIKVIQNKPRKQENGTLEQTVQMLEEAMAE